MTLKNRKYKLNEKQKNKIKEIREALNNNDIYTLRKLSRTEGGFVTSELRKLCWPFLLHVDVSEIRISEKSVDESNINNENENNTEENEQQELLEQSTNTNIPNEKKVGENINENGNINSDLDRGIFDNKLKEEIIENSILNKNSNIVEEINNKEVKNPNIKKNNNNLENINNTINNDSNDIEIKETALVTNAEKSSIENNIQESNEQKSVEDNNEIFVKEKKVENEEKVEVEKKEKIGKEEKVKKEERLEKELIDKKKITNNDNSKKEEQYKINDNITLVDKNNEIEKNNVKQKVKDNEIKNNEEIGLNEKDDLNSDTLKDENNENVDNITNENILVASQSSNEDTYLVKESIDKKEVLLCNSDNEDYTKNNHSDDDGDDILFEGEINIESQEIHESHYKDSGENKGIFENNEENLNKRNDDSKAKKIVAKDVILDPDDDPDRVSKLKQIENESKYRDKKQIMLDVNRAFVHFPKDLKAKEKTIKQIELSKVILYSLKDHSYLHYYQGYHDICSLLLLVLGEDIAKPCAEILALYWLREYMKETLEPTLEVMSFLYPILKYADPKIYKLVYNNMIPPYFSISWVITWCIHDLKDTSEMERIFDFFISNNPIMPIYFAAAVILTQKEKLYKRFPQISNENSKSKEDDDTDPDTAMPNFAVVHQFLTNLLPIATQTNNVTVDSAVELAWNLYEQYPLKFLMKKESIKLNPLCCVKRYFNDCEKVLPNKPFNKEEIIKLLKEEEKLNLEKTMASPNDRIKKIQEKADIIGRYLSQRITLLTIATTLILVTAIILTHEFSKTYYM